jgi:hypothetical protein
VQGVQLPARVDDSSKSSLSPRCRNNSKGDPCYRAAFFRVSSVPYILFNIPGNKILQKELGPRDYSAEAQWPDVVLACRTDLCRSVYGKKIQVALPPCSYCVPLFLLRTPRLSVPTTFLICKRVLFLIV